MEDSKLKEAEALLKDALCCFNEMPNKRICTARVKDTYSLAAKIEKYFSNNDKKININKTI